MPSLSNSPVIPAALLETWRSLLPALESWICHRWRLPPGDAAAHAALVAAAKLLRDVTHPLPEHPRERHRFLFAILRRIAAEPLESPSPTPGNRNPDPRIATLLNTLASLPDAERRLLVRVGLEGLAVAEAARLEGRPVSDAAVRWATLRRSLESDLWAMLPGAQFAE